MCSGVHGECVSCVWMDTENVCRVFGCAWGMYVMCLGVHGEYMSCVWVCMGNVCHVFGWAWRMDIMCLGVHGDCVLLYIFQTTQTVKSMVVCTAFLQPEFGKPLESPPRRPYPIKFMSPPSTASSILSVNSRTEGEGNEDGQCQCFASRCQISVSCF